MFRKLCLVPIMGVILAGAAVTSTAVPVLLAMEFLILFALAIAMRSEQQE